MVATASAAPHLGRSLKMKRIAIIGSGGAGKSTLASLLGEMLNLPVYHLDRLFWKPGWVEPKKEDWRQIQKDICSSSEWVMDGNYGGTMNVRFSSCDTVIFFDLSRTLCLFRALKRSLQFRNQIRPDMAEGCPEKIDIEFIKWIWDYPKTRRPGILQKLNELKGEKEIYILSSRKSVNSFLKEIKEKAVNKSLLDNAANAPCQS